MNLKTRIGFLKKRQVVKILSLSLQWCRENLGTKRGVRKITLIPLARGGRYGKVWVSGSFQTPEQEIRVYWKNIDEIRDLIKTLIHEYKHYLQPATRDVKLHSDLPSWYIYEEWREKEATDIARKFCSSCWRFVQSQLTEKDKVKHYKGIKFL